MLTDVVPGLTFITGNASKAEQLAYHLNAPVAHRKVDLPEIQSLDLAEIVDQKARSAYEIVGSPVLVEDTALVFHALGRLPGPLVKWFLTELGNDGLTQLLNGYDNRAATARVLFGWFDGQELRTFTGEMAGRIAEQPRGEQGFGWDPIFIPAGYDRTWGEMSPQEQKATSMRRMALQQLEAMLSR